jgi:1,2-diacylglycerol 3-beta-galactosyltransferase
MPHILFIMSDTGGGHRAGCRAIEAAMQTRFPGQFTFEMVDAWKDYTIFPFNTLPRTYVKWVNKSPQTYAAQYWMNDHLLRSYTIGQMYSQQLYKRMRRMFKEHPADIVVCAHSVFVRPGMYAIRKAGLGMPFITVITDYAWPIVLWYDRHADRTLVPTEPAYQRGLKLGLKPEQMVLTGAPVHPKFSDLKLSKREAREQLGWDLDARIVLMVGGGDGMGPIVETAKAIDAQPTDCHLAVIAGRNEEMKTALEAISWKRPTQIYGFVNNIEVLMRAADLLITKAGPGTITEAATIGVPMILSGAIPYQESPNIDYVVERGAGVYAPGPRKVAESVVEILSNGGVALQYLSDGVRKLAQPDAIWKIADEIHVFAEIKKNG